MIINGNCLEELDKLDENSIDSIVTDPPYELNFMGKGWDNAGVSFNKETWHKCMRVLKPGGYLLAFGGSRTFHRIACAIEDAGFEIRDTVMWLYGSGFPKSMNIGLAIDKKNGVDNTTGVMRNGKVNTGSGIYNWNDPKHKGECVAFPERKAQNEWSGWGTALKPSFEPIIVARKPFKGSLVDNVLKNGVGGINIDECRVESKDKLSIHSTSKNTEQNDMYKWSKERKTFTRPEQNLGRFPANTILTYDETDFEEVCGGFPQSKGGSGKGFKKDDYGFGETSTNFGRGDFKPYNDNGSASRYFYCAKASKKDRDEGLSEDARNIHPTVKPTSLMQYLVRLVSPKGATVLDPFMGSGSTGKAVAYENMERNADYKFIGIELDPQYCKIAEARIAGVKGEE